jgi:anti-sigma regulatory factor (Ser/Thr protein kinase)
MNIFIPNSAFLGNIESFTNNFNPEDNSILYVKSNPNWISVHPIVISMIVALAEEAHMNNTPIKCDPITAKSRPYLQRMGLIDSLDPNHGVQIDEHESAGRFIPARRINNSLELNQFITDMVPLLHTTPEQAYPIKYVMSELVRNVLEHSQSKIGAIVCAQYFKKTNRISIGVADRGIGIKSAINISHNAKSDVEALNLALRPGITGTTKKIGGTEYNAGAGLFFTKSIAKVSRDFFLIYSGNAFFKLLKPKPEYYVQLFADPVLDKSNFKSNGLPNWQGTAVGIDISMDVNQDFDDLLGMIREAYHLDVKRANKEKYKKPKFL